MALPVVRQQYATQVRMSVEDNTEEIVSFALMPVCRAPNAGNGRHVNVAFIQKDFQPEPVVLRGGEQMIVDFKARLLFNAAVSAANVGEEIEPRIGFGFQRGSHFNNMQRRHNRGHFAEGLNNLGYPVAVFTL